jgi:hypothetical protein
MGNCEFIALLTSVSFWEVNSERRMANHDRTPKTWLVYGVLFELIICNHI